MRTCIVIGSGIAGIASSIRLSKLGYGVTVYEANNYPGGKLSGFKQGDYRFDAGASLFTMPMFVDELFELCGENPRDHFNYIKTGADKIAHILAKIKRSGYGEWQFRGDDVGNLDMYGFTSEYLK